MQIVGLEFDAGPAMVLFNGGDHNEGSDEGCVQGERVVFALDLRGLFEGAKSSHGK